MIFTPWLGVLNHNTSRQICCQILPSLETEMAKDNYNKSWVTSSLKVSWSYLVSKCHVNSYFFLGVRWACVCVCWCEDSVLKTHLYVKDRRTKTENEILFLHGAWGWSRCKYLCHFAITVSSNTNEWVSFYIFCHVHATRENLYLLSYSVMIMHKPYLVVLFIFEALKRTIHTNT